jgi:DNA transformation protein
MSTLSNLPNVGRVLENNLIMIGIETPDQLRRIGAEEAFIRIRTQIDPNACLHMLYGIQGAIDGIPDKRLSPETKAELKNFYNKL